MERTDSMSADPVSEVDAKAVPRSLGAQAYDEIRARLRSDAVSPESRLVEADLAAQLGMSRVPIRQALHSLVAEGLLVGTARGYRVPVLSSRDIEEVFELRKLLEPRAAALAARDITDQQIESLRQHVSNASQAHREGDIGKLFQCSLRFRDTWLSAVHNARLAETITRYSDQVLQVRHLTLKIPAIQEAVIRGFDAILKTLESRDSIAAHDVMLQFVLAAERDYAALRAATAADDTARSGDEPSSA